MSAATSPKTVLVLFTAVALDPLKDVTVTYSVSSVVLQVPVSHRTCCNPWISTAITQDEQLVLVKREVSLLGEAVMLPEEKDVVFAKEGLDGDVADKAGLDITTNWRYFFAYLIGPLTQREKAGSKGAEEKKTSTS